MFTTNSSTSILGGQNLTISGFVSNSGTSIVSPSGTMANVVISGNGTINDGGKKGISATLYFKYVKSKLTKTQQKVLYSRLIKLKDLYDSANMCGQDGLADVLLTKLAITIREQEAVVCGYDKFILGADIKKFKGLVLDNNVSMCLLKNFPRPIPKKMITKIASAQSKGVFDEFHVLFLNPTNARTLPTQKEKIIEKDPIVFGKFSFDDRYFYICDWIDEYCDLTLDKFCETMQKDSKLKEVYELGEVSTLTNRELSNIKDEVAASYERLKSANASNYLALAEQATKKPQNLSLGQKVWHWFYRLLFR